MLDIQKINDTFIDIVSESKKLFDNKYDLGQLFEFKEKILAKYFSVTYDYYFAKRIFQNYEHLTIAETIDQILRELEETYGSLERPK